jgi:hypothetical protein
MVLKSKRYIHRIGWVHILAAALIAINIFLGYELIKSDKQPYYEASEISKTNYSFAELTKYFTNLSNKKGAVYAFEILKRADVPPNIDIHLLGHTIGDILYKQQGAKGIYYCTQDFRNACSHTIVIGTLLEKGPQSVQEIVKLCKEAPGGKGAYNMCFHGLGHGVLAYNEYELPKAVDMCNTIGNSIGREAVECIGGTIMEMVSGVHDKEMWQEKSKVYFKKEDPVYPCSASFIPKEAKFICFNYLTTHIWEAAGADIGHPTPTDYKKAFQYCWPLTGDSRVSCFDGFGKEFLTLAQNRDIRRVDKMTDEQFSKVLDWCELAGREDGKKFCMMGALHSLFWGGENDPFASVRFCKVAETRKLGAACFSELLSITNYFISNPIMRQSLCSAYPEAYSRECFNSLSLKK